MLLASFAEDDKFAIPSSNKAIKLDGVFSSNNEWEDASEIKIENEKHVTYLRAKYDEGFLYIMIDFLSDLAVERSGDWAVVCLDTKNDGKTPLADDYCFYRATRAGDLTSGIMQGNGNGWKIIQEAETIGGFKARTGYSHMNDPYEGKINHVSYEFRIPMEYLQKEMGFYVYVNDGYKNEYAEWPRDAGGKQFGIDDPTIKDVLASPSKWGNLHLK